MGWKFLFQSRKKDNQDASGQTVDNQTPEDSQNAPLADDDEDSIDPSDVVVGVSDVRSSSRLTNQVEARPVREKLPIYALDQAILESIDRCGGWR